MYRAKRELDRAKYYHQRALAIREKQLSPDHLDFAQSYNNLGLHQSAQTTAPVCTNNNKSA